MPRNIFFGACGLVVLALLLNGQGQSQIEDQVPSAEVSQIQLHVSHAQACVRLAEAELQISQEMNLMATDTVPQIRIDWLQANLDFARKQLEVAQQYEYGAAVPLQLVYAEKSVALAERELEEAVFVNKGMPSRISQLNVERLRAKAEIAALRLKMWRSDRYVHSLIDQMQWQIDRLTEQIIDLNHRVGKNAWQTQSRSNSQ
jgi:hypothetical protein